MKTIILSLTLMFFICSCKVGKKVSVTSYTNKISLDTITLDSLFWEGMRCGVAHGTEEGWFSCDFKGTYYPFHIFDTTIKKWFIKIQKNGDSLFYYERDFEKVYIWNGSGYERGNENWSQTTYRKYNGSDTLREMEQVWEPKN